MTALMAAVKFLICVSMSIEESGFFFPLPNNQLAAATAPAIDG